MQIKGHLYFEGEHDILNRKRTVIGEGGQLTAVENLPNNRIVDNQYGKLVLQKANYILGQPFVVEGDNKQYIELLKQVFDKRFMRLLKNAGKAALNGGLSWLYPYFDGEGKLRFRLFPAYEVLPFWKDSEHTVLDCAVRLYLVQGYEGTTPVLIDNAEWVNRYDNTIEIKKASSLINKLGFSKQDEINIADVGCGSGRSTKWIKPILYNSTIDAIDLNQDCIEYAKDLHGEDANFISADAFDYFKYQIGDNKKYNLIFFVWSLFDMVDGLDRESKSMRLDILLTSVKNALT